MQYSKCKLVPDILSFAFCTLYFALYISNFAEDNLHFAEDNLHFEFCTVNLAVLPSSSYLINSNPKIKTEQLTSICTMAL